MAWGKVDDTYYDHPKLDHVETTHGPMMRLAVAGLNALAWSYCNRFLTDGFIASRAIAKLGGLPEVVDALVECGLWDEADRGYQVHDFLVHNDSREAILERRAKEAKRKADWRAGKRPGGTDDGTDGGTDDTSTHDVPAGQAKRPGGTRARASRDASRSANPDPSRPVPSHVETPNPRTAGATVGGRRANGTNPRALAKAQTDLTEEGDRARAWRRNQRKLAYLRGAIGEAEQLDMDARDASLEEIPDQAEHIAALRAHQDEPSPIAQLVGPLAELVGDAT